MSIFAWALIAGIFIAFILIVISLVNMYRRGFRNEWLSIFVAGIVALYLFYIIYYRDSIEPVDWVQIMLTTGLITVTCVYALLTSQIAKSTKEQAEATAKQADANVIMAEEMKEQRISSLRPVIIQKATHEQDLIEGNPSDHYLYFEIYNAGNSPAIELEISLARNYEDTLDSHRETYLRNSDPSIRFNPPYLSQIEESSRYYIVCQYKSPLPGYSQQTWYQTWLPFEVVKASKEGKIYIKPGELEFKEVTEQDRIQPFGGKPK